MAWQEPGERGGTSGTVAMQYPWAARLGTQFCVVLVSSGDFQLCFIVGGVKYGEELLETCCLPSVVMPGLGLLATMDNELNPKVLLPIFLQVHPFLIDNH